MKRLLLLAFALLISGCAQLGMQKPESPEDQLRYGQAGVSGVYKTIGDLKAAGSITTDEGVSMFRQAEGIERDLKALEPLIVGASPTSQNAAAAKLQLTLAALVALQTELRKRQGTKASALILQPAAA